MHIPVVLKDGQELSVSKDELQFLLFAKQIMFFERSGVWVVVGRDRLRSQSESFSGEDRRRHGELDKNHWY